jgi:butyrate kinase
MFGKVDAILLTGGLAHSEYITNKIKERVEFLAPVKIYPGEDEMLAMAENAFAVLNGEREVLQYQ